MWIGCGGEGRRRRRACPSPPCLACAHRRCRHPLSLRTAARPSATARRRIRNSAAKTPCQSQRLLTWRAARGEERSAPLRCRLAARGFAVGARGLRQPALVRLLSHVRVLFSRAAGPLMIVRASVAEQNLEPRHGAHLVLDGELDRAKHRRHRLRVLRAIAAHLLLEGAPLPCRRLRLLLRRRLRARLLGLRRRERRHRRLQPRLRVCRLLVAVRQIGPQLRRRGRLRIQLCRLSSQCCQLCPFARH